MFEVHAEYLIDEYWSITDDLILKAAGRGNGALAVGASTQTRYLIWTVDSFDEAVGLRKRVGLVDGVKATIREV